MSGSKELTNPRKIWVAPNSFWGVYSSFLIELNVLKLTLVD